MNRLNRIINHIIPENINNNNNNDMDNNYINYTQKFINHTNKSKILWNGTKDDIQFAINIFLNYNITNYPIININTELNKSYNKLLNLINYNESCLTPNYIKSNWDINHILITGTTGFIGIHLLIKILTLFPYSNLYCLIRGINEEHCYNRLLNNAKNHNLEILLTCNKYRIICIPGNINKKNLGILENDYNYYLKKIDTVLHFAAKDNFFLPFNLLQDNINGLINIIDFCSKIKIKSLMYCSSCLINLVESIKFKNIENIGLYNGYAQTKYIAHKLIENIKLFYNDPNKIIPISLINLGYVFPHYNLDNYDINKKNINIIPTAIIPDITDSIEMVIKTFLKTNSIFNSDINIPIDYVSVDYVSNCICEILQTNKNINNNNYLWHNIYNPKPLYFKDIINIIKKKREFDILKNVSIKEFCLIWKNTLNNSTTNNSKYLLPIISDIFESQMIYTFNFKNTYKSKLYKHPEITYNYLYKYIDIIDNFTIL